MNVEFANDNGQIIAAMEMDNIPRHQETVWLKHEKYWVTQVVWSGPPPHVVVHLTLV